MKRWFVIFGIIMFLIQIPVSAEKVNLELYAKNFDSIPIAVVKFKAAAGAGTITANEPWRVIAGDLAFSGRFDVVKADKYDSAAFGAHQAGIYVDGEYSADGDDIVIDCYLRDVSTRELLLGKKFRGTRSMLRSMAHRFSNRIVEVLLGDQGYFESRVLYVKDIGKSKNIGVMDFDGANQRMVTSNSSINIFPVFADTNKMIWTSFLKGKPDIFSGSILSGRAQAIITSRFVSTSPDVNRIEGKIVFASSRNGNMNIFTASLDGSGIKQLTFDKSINTSPAWSPNGYQIVFTSDRTGTPQLFVMDADGANLRRLTYEGKYQDSPAWSPRGDKIAYQSLQNGNWDIWTIQPDGSNAIQVTGGSGNDEYPTWSPDGTQIMFEASGGGKSDIWVVKAGGGQLKRVTANGDVKMPCWGF